VSKGIERKTPVLLSGYIALGFGSSSVSVFMDGESEKYRKNAGNYLLYLVQPPSLAPLTARAEEPEI
jgi:hypothetical protein